MNYKKVNYYQTYTIIIKVFICCGFIFLSALLSNILFNFFPKTNTQTEPIVNFSEFFAEQINSSEWNGPKLNQPVELENFYNSNRNRLVADFNRYNYILLAVISPDCGFCIRSKEMFQEIFDIAESKNLPYYFVSFENTNSDKFFYYTNKLNSKIPAFVWDKNEMNSQLNLQKTPTPTHILIDKQGKIRGIYVGGASDQTAYSKIIDAIFDDINEVKHFDGIYD